MYERTLLEASRVLLRVRGQLRKTSEGCNPSKVIRRERYVGRKGVVERGIATDKRRERRRRVSGENGGKEECSELSENSDQLLRRRKEEGKR